jgi:hypothetical protein
MKAMKISVKVFLLLTSVLLVTGSCFAAGRNDNLKVLSDKDYRKSLEEIVVTARPEQRSTQTDRKINLEPSPTRLQWLPQFDKNSAESIQPRSESEEKPLIKLFEKKF